MIGRASSINLQMRQASGKRKESSMNTGSLERRRGGGASSSLWKLPRSNASNNVNGDEFFKHHLAEGKFQCLRGCQSCTCQLKAVAMDKFKG